MRPLAVVLLALAMSTDAFAAAVGKGVALHRPRWPEAIRCGLIFGTIECATPLVGWLLGAASEGLFRAYAAWVAAGLLGVFGVRMIVAAVRGADDDAPRPERHGFWDLAATGFATSIDAMAVGAGLALLDVPIVPIALSIGLATFAMATLGVMLGRILGPLAGRWAGAAGGVVLILIGAASLRGIL